MADHFFIVGAQRTGTSYLYTLLDEHPDIAMAKPMRPEPKFFLGDASTTASPTSYRAALFGENARASRFGEKSTTYIEREDAAQRIATLFPDARILMVLRDPIERAISNYAFSCSNGFETLPLWEAFTQEDERVSNYDRSKVSASPYAYLRRGRYIDAVRLYEKYFASENIHLILHESLVSASEDLGKVYALLGVDSDFTPPSMGHMINPTTTAQPNLTGKQYAQLVEEFAPYSRSLAEHTGLDLSAWKSVQ